MLLGPILLAQIAWTLGFTGDALQQQQQHKDTQTKGILLDDSSWPTVPPEAGYITDVATGASGELLIFDRVDRTWTTEGTFDEDNNYMHQDLGPIREGAIKRLDVDTGAVVGSFGENVFYMPHGLTVDKDGNYWTTDTALHQVHKFDNNEQLVRTWGERFVPASDNQDKERFCQPSAVAVAAWSGDFFVSDGYCNNRVVKFNAAGELSAIFQYDFNIPHSLVLIEDEDTLCVADCKNMRIVCLLAGLTDPTSFGRIVRIFDDPGIANIYSIAFNPVEGLLYGLTPGTNEKKDPRGFTIDYFSPNGAIIAIWKPNEGFDVPHGMALSEDGTTVYVCEVAINRKNLYKLTKP